MTTIITHGEPLSETNPEETIISGDVINIVTAITRLSPIIAQATTSKTSPTIKFFGAVGGQNGKPDEVGTQVSEFLAQEGINTEHIYVIDGKPSARLNTMVDSKGERVHQTSKREESAGCFLFDPQIISNQDDHIRQITKEADILITSGIALSRPIDEASRKKLLEFMAGVKEHGGTVIMDTNHRPAYWNSREVAEKNIIKAYEIADVVFIGTEDARDLHQLTSPNDIADMLLEHNVQTVIVKDGERGSYLYTNDAKHSVVKIPATPDIKQVSALGAGDNYVGGTIASLIHGRNLVESLMVGALVGGKVVQHHGAILREEFLPTVDEVNQVLENAKTIQSMINANSGECGLRQ